MKHAFSVSGKKDLFNANRVLKYAILIQLFSLNPLQTPHNPRALTRAKTKKACITPDLLWLRNNGYSDILLQKIKHSAEFVVDCVLRAEEGTEEIMYVHFFHYFEKNESIDGTAMNEWSKRITINPEQCGGRPCIRGLRIRVIDILDLLAAGLSYNEIIEELPDIEKDDIVAALKYASRKLDHPVIAA